jgi:hypothetical protein
MALSLVEPRERGVVLDRTERPPWPTGRGGRFAFLGAMPAWGQHEEGSAKDRRSAAELPRTPSSNNDSPGFLFPCNTRFDSLARVPETSHDDRVLRSKFVTSK